MRVLFVLSQRPELTGSGITLDALVREAAAAGHEPWVLCGMPTGTPIPAVGGLPPGRVLAVTFGDGGDLPFAVPGMSDVMPYRSTVWSAMSATQLEAYRNVWRRKLTRAVAACRPDLVHCNHLWLVSALAPDVLAAAGGIPSVAHCHATGLRQMDLCPHLRDEVTTGLRRHGAFLALHDDLAARVSAALGVARSRIVEVGAGFREDLFHERGAAAALDRQGHVLYVGKFAAAKGLPWLLDAVAALRQAGDPITLHIAGDGAGDEAEALRARMAAQDGVVVHGRLDQPSLADLMRRMAVLALPSFYEGLPLVLAEARACGCRLVGTALPGVVQRLAPLLGDDLLLVPPPRLDGPDRPVAADLPAFTGNLAATLRSALRQEPVGPAGSMLQELTWRAVYTRVASAWQSLVA